MSSRVVMKVMDQDLVKDEVVGSMVFNLKDCIGSLNGKFFWKNIYGAPLDKSGANTEMMNSNPEVASTWKGRILMKVEAKKTDRPVCKAQEIDEEGDDIDEADPYLENRDYEIIAEVGQGIALPSDSKYRVMIKIAEHELVTPDPVLQKGCYNRWLHRFSQQTLSMPYKDIYDIGKIFIYLMNGKDPISYYKADIETFMNQSPEIQWFEMNPDLSIGKIKDHYKSGIISVKISIHNKSAKGPFNFSDVPAWKAVPNAKRIGVKTVRAYIYQCRDLPAADADGQSDPFIKVWDSTPDEKKTIVIEDNNNPLFYQTLELKVEA